MPNAELCLSSVLRIRKLSQLRFQLVWVVIPVQTELELDLLHFQISKSLNFRVRVTDSFFEFCKIPTHIDKRVFEANEKTEIRKGKDSIRCSLQVLNTFSIQLWKWHLSSIVIQKKDHTKINIQDSLDNSSGSQWLTCKTHWKDLELRLWQMSHSS